MHFVEISFLVYPIVHVAYVLYYLFVYSIHWY